MYYEVCISGLKHQHIWGEVWTVHLEIDISTAADTSTVESITCDKCIQVSKTFQTNHSTDLINCIARHTIYVHGGSMILTWILWWDHSLDDWGIQFRWLDRMCYINMYIWWESKTTSSQLDRMLLRKSSWISLDWSAVGIRPWSQFVSRAIRILLVNSVSDCRVASLG